MICVRGAGEQSLQQNEGAQKRKIDDVQEPLAKQSRLMEGVVHFDDDSTELAGSAVDLEVCERAARAFLSALLQAMFTGKAEYKQRRQKQRQREKRLRYKHNKKQRRQAANTSEESVARIEGCTFSQVRMNEPTLQSHRR